MRSAREHSDSPKVVAARHLDRFPFVEFLVLGGPPPPVSREDFVKAIGQIRKGMAEKDVLSILGQPDDIRTQFDPGGMSTFGTKEIWGYGTDGHLSFPTLGCIFIDTAGRAEYIFGATGQPPHYALFTEDELRGLLRLINTTSGYEGDYYNPLSVIKVVNALQALGKQKALAAIDEYLRVSDEFTAEHGREGMFLVLRVTV